jgi:hypothetical protein
MVLKFEINNEVFYNLSKVCEPKSVREFARYVAVSLNEEKDKVIGYIASNGVIAAMVGEPPIYDNYVQLAWSNGLPRSGVSRVVYDVSSPIAILGTAKGPANTPARYDTYPDIKSYLEIMAQKPLYPEIPAFINAEFGKRVKKDFNLGEFIHIYGATSKDAIVYDPKEEGFVKPANGWALGNAYNTKLFLKFLSFVEGATVITESHGHIECNNPHYLGYGCLKVVLCPVSVTK